MTHTAFPDLLSRLDVSAGPWEVTTGMMGPNAAWTAIGQKQMHVPHGDTDNERTVRAHEMMHAKVSPKPADMRLWLQRGRATQEAHTAAEELRVNTLIKRAKFNVDCLTDGSETYGGEQMASNNLWREAVLTTCAFANTGRFKLFLVGVRRHNPEWAKSLRAFHDRLAKEINKIPSEALANTSTTKHGLTPSGYVHTEAIAALVDHMSMPPTPPPSDPHGNLPAGSQTPPSPPSVEQIKKLTVDPQTVVWDTLRWGYPPKPRYSPGGMGRKKRSSATGRAPTRINRLLTDPHKRVFTKKITGDGGVVLIDGSGSMLFDHSDIMAIAEAAPGCTVAMYCSSRVSVSEGTPNIWLLADKGRMVASIPNRHPGNGVDHPAICWAIAARQKASSPVVWVTDGHVHGVGQNFTIAGSVDCAKVAYTNGVIVRPNVTSAVKTLRDMQHGKRPKRWFPLRWREAWREAFAGARLPSSNL